MVLFDDLIPLTEKIVDFRLMVEGGALQGEHDIGGAGDSTLTDRLETEEERRIKSDAMDLSRILIDENDLKLEKNSDDEVVLGRGGFGKVTVGRYRNNEVAVKMMRADVDEESMEENLIRFRRECVFMKELKHENIVMLIGAIWNESLICCVMEYVDGGTLEEVLASPRILTWPDARFRYVLGIARGMAYLHNCVFYDSVTKSYTEGVVHRDLKPQNVLLAKSTDAPKIVDFGESRVVTSDLTMTLTGTPFFMAPEVARGERYDSSCDIYSFAMVLVEICQEGTIAELCTQAMPVKNIFSKSRFKILSMLNANKIRPLLSTKGDTPTPSSIRNLVEDCWDADKGKRPTFWEVVGRLQNEVTEEIAKICKGNQVEFRKNFGGEGGDTEALSGINGGEAQRVMKEKMEKVKELQKERKQRASILMVKREEEDRDESRREEEELRRKVTEVRGKLKELEEKLKRCES